MTAPAEIMYHRVSWVVESKLVTLSCDACTWPRVIGHKQVRFAHRGLAGETYGAHYTGRCRVIPVVLRISRFERTVSNVPRAYISKLSSVSE